MNSRMVFLARANDRVGNRCPEMVSAALDMFRPRLRTGKDGADEKPTFQVAEIPLAFDDSPFADFGPCTCPATYIITGSFPGR